MPETDGLVTLRERVRERLAFHLSQAVLTLAAGGITKAQVDAVVAAGTDAILREFRLQPVAWGRVTEGGEVEGF
jgi:hypothetical protein